MILYFPHSDKLRRSPSPSSVLEGKLTHVLISSLLLQHFVVRLSPLSYFYGGLKVSSPHHPRRPPYVDNLFILLFPLFGISNQGIRLLLKIFRLSTERIIHRVKLKLLFKHFFFNDVVLLFLITYIS